MNKESMRSTPLRIFLLLLSFTGLLWSQAETGQITGTITDASGASISNAAVTVTNAATGAERLTRSNSAGIYAVPNLTPGDYNVKVTSAGFSTFETKITITVGAKVGQDVKLQIGKEVVTVEVKEIAAAIKVNTETQTINQTLNTAAMTELPTSSRNPYALVVTAGNVSEDDPGQNGVGVSMNGMRSAGTNVLLDGVANNDEFGASVGQQVPVDSVQEVGITTANFTAETGRASGGVINVTTKSGTNEFHGTAYEFNRVSALASNSFNNNANGVAEAKFTRNNFGFSLGGPAIKNKLFFFNNTEWTRVRSIQNYIEYVFDPAYIASATSAAQQVYSKYGKLVPSASVLGVYSRAALIAQGNDPCAGSSATGGCKSYNANAPMLDLISYSAPAGAGGGLPQNTYNTVSRVDYNLNDRTQAYVRYALYSETDLPGSESNSAYTGVNTPQLVFNNSLLLAVTHSFSDHFISQTKLDFNRFNLDDPISPEGIAPDYQIANQTQLGNYNIAMPGGTTPFGGPQNFGQLYEDLSYTVGKHEIRWGGSQTYLRDNRTFGAYEDSTNVVGYTLGQGMDNLISGQEYQFAAAINPQGKYPCINSVQTAACTINLPVVPPTFERSNRYEESALYLQDSWKYNKRLTLNIGVRWEYFGTQHNVNPNLDSNFYLPNNVSPQNPAFPQAVANGMVQPAPQSSYGALWYASPLNFAPKLGFAWDVFGDGKTAFRGGYSINYERNFGNVTFNVLFHPPNYAVVNLFERSQDFTTIPLSTSNYGILTGSGGSAALPPSELRWVQPNIPQSYAHSFSASIEHQFGSNMHLELDYSGTIGENQYDISSANFPGSGNYYLGIPCTPGDCNATLNQQYGSINLRGAGGHSSYNALNTRYDIQDVGHTGLTLRMNYTYSHSIDDLSDTFSSSSNQFNLGYTDFQNPSVDKGSSDFDNRHRISIGAIWAIPFLKSSKGILHAVAYGWELAPVFTARTGAPYTIYDLTNDNYISTRVVLNQAAPAATRIAAGTNAYTVYNFANINTGAYINPVTGDSDFGPFPANMTGRDAFRSPGTWNLDLGMYKNVRLTESKSLQLRLESYNADNHANFSINKNNAYIIDGTGSTITGSYNGNRNVQLGAKFIF